MNNKTQSPEKKIFTFPALALPGNIICDENKKYLKTELFVIAGRSYNETALVRLFAFDEINAEMTEKLYPLSYKVKTSKESLQFLTPVYIDISHLIIRENSFLIPLLVKHPGRVAGSIHKRDLDGMIKTIGETNTISNDIKDKYF